MRFLTNDECAEWTIRNAYPVAITGRPVPEPLYQTGLDYQDTECPVEALFADVGMTPYKTERCLESVRAARTLRGENADRG